MLLTRDSKACKIPDNISRLKLLTVLASFVFLLGLTLFVTLVDIIPFILRRQLRLAKGSLFHEFLEQKEVESGYFYVHMFNYTNVDRFISGEDYKLKVEDIGPINYRELRRHENIQFYPEREIMAYSPRYRLLPYPEIPGLRPEEINLTLPNTPILVSTSFARQLPLTRIGFNAYASLLRPKAFLHLDAKSYLWGYSEPMISIAHTIFPGLVSFDKMGILPRLYDDNNYRLEVSTNDLTKFMVKTRNGYKKLKTADYIDPDQCDKCCSFENTYEGIGFPTGVIDPEFKMFIYKNGVCKTGEMEFHERKQMFYGSEALIFNLSDNFFLTDPEKPANGILEIPDCLFGMSLGLTKPHFVDVDPKRYERLEGIKPGKDLYKGWVAIDPKLGVSVGAEAFVQINAVLGDLSFNAEAKPFSNMILPIMYIKLVQPPLLEEVLVKLNLLYYIAPIVIKTVQTVFCSSTLFLFIYFVRLVYLAWMSQRRTLREIGFEANAKQQSIALKAEEFWLLEQL